MQWATLLIQITLSTSKKALLKFSAIVIRDIIYGIGIMCRLRWNGWLRRIGEKSLSDDLNIEYYLSMFLHYSNGK